jgi:nucleotide-binding universal stress UspA family protein
MQKILVAVDLTDVTEPLTEVAGALSRFTGCSLTLLYVTPGNPRLADCDPAKDPAGYIDGEPERRARDRLAMLAETIGDGDLEVDVQLVQGDPGEEILKLAEDGASELIVLGAHRHNLIERVLLGSVSEAVLRGAPCPVLVIPSRLLRSG